MQTLDNSPHEAFHEFIKIVYGNIIAKKELSIVTPRLTLRIIIQFGQVFIKQQTKIYPNCSRNCYSLIYFYLHIKGDCLTIKIVSKAFFFRQLLLCYYADSCRRFCLQGAQSLSQLIYILYDNKRTSNIEQSLYLLLKNDTIN